MISEAFGGTDPTRQVSDIIYCIARNFGIQWSLLVSGLLQEQFPALICLPHPFYASRIQ